MQDHMILVTPTCKCILVTLMHPGNIRPGNIHPGNIRPGNIHPGNIRPGNIHPGNIHPGNNAMHPGNIHVFPYLSVHETYCGK